MANTSPFAFTSHSRAVAATVLIIELLDHDAAPAVQQQALHKALREALIRATDALPAATWQMRDTDRGAQVTFLATPEHACLVALRLMRTVTTAPDTLNAQSLRMGIHFGTVLATGDQSRYLGEGVKTAVQLVEGAAPGQALASRAFFDAVAHVDHGMDRLFGPAYHLPQTTGRPLECHPLTTDEVAFTVLEKSAHSSQASHPTAQDNQGFSQLTELVKNWFAPLNVVLGLGSFVVAILGTFTDRVRGIQMLALTLMVLGLVLGTMWLLKQVSSFQRLTNRYPAFVRALTNWPFVLMMLGAALALEATAWKLQTANTEPTSTTKPAIAASALPPTQSADPVPEPASTKPAEGLSILPSDKALLPAAPPRPGTGSESLASAPPHALTAAKIQTMSEEPLPTKSSRSTPSKATTSTAATIAPTAPNSPVARVGPVTPKAAETATRPARCTHILQKATLDEPLSPDEQRFLSSSCQ